MDIETVEIVNAGAKSGFTRINKSDYDPARHVLVADANAAAEMEAKVKAEEAAKAAEDMAAAIAAEAAAKAAADAKAEEAAKAAKGAKG
jgi:hypothetical protein